MELASRRRSITREQQHSTRRLLLRSGGSRPPVCLAVPCHLPARRLRLLTPTLPLLVSAYSSFPSERVLWPGEAVTGGVSFFFSALWRGVVYARGVRASPPAAPRDSVSAREHRR
jgi:hypothetical protein